MRERRFTEKEAGEIVRRAAESQSRLPRDSSGEGIAEQELRAAARELGIDDVAFDQAVEAQESSPPPEKAGLFGGPFRYETEAILDGPVDDACWEDIVAEVRRTYGEPGKVEKRGSTYEWVGTGGGLANTTLTVTQGKGSARLRITAVLEGAAFIPYLLAVIPAFIGIALISNLKLPMEFMFGVLTWVIPFIAARQVCVAASRSHRKRTKSLVSRIRRKVGDAGLVRENLRATPPLDQATEDLDVRG